MKKKLNAQFLLIAGVSIVATLILTAAVSYELFKDEIYQNLKNYAQLFDSLDLETAEEAYSENGGNFLRVSVIDTDGSVLYDSAADVSEMENHLERPEVQEALATGEGYDVRTSETMSISNFYYAMLLDDGKILRVSEESDSFYQLLLSTLPVLVVIAIVLFAISFVLTHFLIRAFVSPIEKMAANLEEASPNEAYVELRPFIAKIKKQHEDILKSANMRQEFTANVTHELKTPLTSISGYSELIANGMAGEKDIEHFAREIHRNADRLLSLINDIIRLSELDVINQDLEVADVDLYEVADSCVQMLEVNATQHNVTISLHGDHVHASLNKDMMEELVYNLCDNAIRYNNPQGSVDVYVENKEGHPILRVSDTGIGIPKEHQERIFERFYRVDKSRSKSSGGTGLGLAIVKHIVSAHSAELKINSEPGQGTEISVVFPG